MVSTLGFSSGKLIIVPARARKSPDGFGELKLDYFSRSLGVHSGGAFPAVIVGEFSLASGYNGGMKYSLRSLMILVTIVCVVLGRVAYLRSQAAFHEHEAERYAWKIEQNQSPHPMFLFDDLERFRFHRILATRYRHATFRPWLIVDESPPPEEPPLPMRIDPEMSPPLDGAGDPADPFDL